MSWAAWLMLTKDGEEVAINEDSFNCTHNCNGMIDTVLEERGHEVERSWWHLLNGLSGWQGEEMLHTIVLGLEKVPDRFRAMNPESGWGDYDMVLVVLRRMLEASKKYPMAKWVVWG